MLGCLIGCCIGEMLVVCSVGWKDDQMFDGLVDGFLVGLMIG